MKSRCSSSLSKLTIFDDVLVLDLGGGLRLPEEALGGVGLVGAALGQDLDRVRLPEVRVGSLVDAAHAAHADQALYVIEPAQRGPDQRIVIRLPFRHLSCRI